MIVLALDGALARCSAALWRDGAVLARAAVDGPRGHAAVLPALARQVLDGNPRFDAVAVGVGPGGFTGLRAAIALAQGLALGAGVPCLGVSTGEALAEELPAALRAGREVWSAVDTKRGRVALERPDAPTAVFAERDLPRPDRPVALVGDAALAVAARLLARGADALLTDLRRPDAAAVAAVAARGLAEGRAPRDAAPLYLDPPAARGPAGDA